MKVHTAAREGLEEYFQSQQAHAEGQLLIEEQAAETFQHDFQEECSETRDEISQQADREGWTPAKWLDAMKDTLMFDDEELTHEYQDRQLLFGSMDEWYWDFRDEDYYVFTVFD